MADIANKNTAGAPVGIVCTEEHLGKTIYLETQEQPYAEHGPLVDGTRPGEETVDSRPDLAWSRIRHTMREAFSEVGSGYPEEYPFKLLMRKSSSLVLLSLLCLVTVSSLKLFCLRMLTAHVSTPFIFQLVISCQSLTEL